jgi:hypothetical protein
MSVRLRYFAWVRERIGKPEEIIEAPAGIRTVGELMTWLASRGEEYAHAFEAPQVILPPSTTGMSVPTPRLKTPVKSRFSHP